MRMTVFLLQSAVTTLRISILGARLSGVEEENSNFMILGPQNILSPVSLVKYVREYQTERF